MYSRSSQMEPLLPEGAGDLEDLGREIVGQSAALAGQLHPVTMATVVELLRLINSYYSNLIEGHSTLPVDIERAMRQDYSLEPARRSLQRESLAHIRCQRAFDERLAATPELNAAAPEFLKWLHGTFYEDLPLELRQVANERTGETIEVVGGEFRTRDVEVGQHVGPTAQSLPAFLTRFASFYKSGAHHGVKPLIAAAASHHRLMWIHPFLDGNGRVARLYTDACFRRVPVLGYGLWNVSRGLARRSAEYMDALARADQPRRNDLDGRGNLSNEGLGGFCRFFLEVCLDQVRFSGSLLKLDGLLERLRGYVGLREQRLVRDRPPLKPQAAYMLQEVLLRGTVARGDLFRVSGMPERTARDLMGQLLDEGLLGADSPKGAVRLALPTHFAGYLFPDLYPRDDAA